MRSKARITITLARDLLSQIDGMIDDVTIRNRSHAIELLLRRSLRPTVHTAAILAAGEDGNGMIPPLRKIGDRLLIEIMLRHLGQHGIRTVFLLAGKHEEKLRAALAETGNPWNLELEFISEGEPRGTAGAVKLIEDQIGSEPLLVLHGDVLTDIDLSEFVQFHQREGTMATIAVKPRVAERRYGKVMLQGNRITEFLDIHQSEGISIVNAGVYLLDPEALHLVEEGGRRTFEQDLFPDLAAIGELSAFIFQGIWYDISQEDSYRLALGRWARKEPA